jgi:hypothetical protein
MGGPKVRYRSIAALNMDVLGSIKTLEMVRQAHQKGYRYMSEGVPQLPWGIWEEWVTTQNTESPSVNEIGKTSESYAPRDDFPSKLQMILSNYCGVRS